MTPKRNTRAMGATKAARRYARDDYRVVGEDALIQLPDEGEDQDEDLHQPHHHQKAVKNVAFFQRIVKIKKSGHLKDGFWVLGFS